MDRHSKRCFSARAGTMLSDVLDILLSQLDAVVDI